MSSQPRNHAQSHTAHHLDVVPDYEHLLILDRSDESLFEAVDLEQNQNQDSVHSLSSTNHHTHPRSRTSTGNSPSSTIMKSSTNASPTRQPLQDGSSTTSNRERQASNSLAPAPVRLAQAQVSLSWTDILRPLMDDDSHRLDKITAPLSVQNEAPQTASSASGEDNLQDLASSVPSKLSASAPASRAGTIRHERSRSPSRDRAHSHAAQQPPSTVFGVMADGRVASPKVSTRRDRSPSTSPSPDAALTQNLQPVPKLMAQQQPPISTQKNQQQQKQQQNPGHLAAESRTQVAASSAHEQYQQLQINVATTSTQYSLLPTNNNSTPPSPNSSRRDYSKEVQPKVNTWRVESPTARRRAQEAAEREAQRQREEQAQREMEEFHRQQLERMREAERRRKVDVETHVCSLDFLVSVGAEEKKPVEPPSPTVKQVQPKVDTWWREGRPRSPTMERANRPQLAALSNNQPQASPVTSESGAQAGASTTSPSRTRKTWGTVTTTSVGTTSPPASNANRNASIDEDSGARQQQQQSPAKSLTGQQQQQQTQMQATRQQQQQPQVQPARQQQQQVLQRPPSPQQSRQSLARPPSPSQSRATMANNLTVNVNNASDQSNATSPPSPNRKPRSPRAANLTIETTQHPTLARQPLQQQVAASSPKSASLSHASARKVASQLSETLDSAIAASATSPATRTSPSRSRTTSATAANASQLNESHGPTRAFLQQQSQNILNDPPSPTTSKRQPSSTYLVPQSPGGTLQRSRKSSSSASVTNNVSFAGSDPSAAQLRKQHRELGTVTNMGAAGGPPAVLTLQARSWRSYVMHEGAYVALLAVFLLLALETLAGDHGRGYNVGCVKIARHLSNTGEVVCHD